MGSDAKRRHQILGHQIYSSQSAQDAAMCLYLILDIKNRLAKTFGTAFYQGFLHEWPSFIKDFVEIYFKDEVYLDFLLRVFLAMNEVILRGFIHF